MLSLYVTLGIFLLVAARNPSENRSLIAFTAWSSFAHAVVTALQAFRNLIPRGELVGVGALVVIGLALVVVGTHRVSGKARWRLGECSALDLRSVMPRLTRKLEDLDHRDPMFGDEDSYAPPVCDRLICGMNCSCTRGEPLRNYPYAGIELKGGGQLGSAGIYTWDSTSAKRGAGGNPTPCQGNPEP